MGNATKTWKDPLTGKEFAYNWGFNTDKEKMPRIAFRKNDESIEVIGDEIILKEPEAITRAKEALDRHIIKEMEKATMEKISYICGRCRANDTPCNPYCAGCTRGSKFVEKSMAYAQADDRITKQILNSIYGAKGFYPARTLPAIKDVKFAPPATIVFWSDKTKTVVKAQGTDVYDPEKGLAMAIIKKLFGNKGNYNNLFHKWIPETKAEPEIQLAMETEPTPEAELELKWRVWFKDFDKDGKPLAAGILPYGYKRKCNATRKAKKHFADRPNVKWIVSQTNPFAEKD